MARQRKSNAERGDRHLDRDNNNVYSSPAKMPPSDRRWHSRARRWYEDLRKSPQSIHYYLSDWDLAWIAAEDLSCWLKLQDEDKTRRNPTIWLQSQRKLMTTHMDRLNGRLEVLPPEADPAGAFAAPDNVVDLKSRFG